MGEAEQRMTRLSQPRLLREASSARSSRMGDCGPTWGGDRSAQCRTDIGARSLKQKKKGRLCGLPIFASGGALLAEKKSARSSSFGRLRGLVGATPPDTAQASAAEGQFKDMSQVCVARRRRGPQPPLSPSLSLVAYLKMSPAGCHRGSVLACGTRLCGAPGIRSS